MVILNLITYDIYALVGYRTFNIFSLFWDSKLILQHLKAVVETFKH